MINGMIFGLSAIVFIILTSKILWPNAKIFVLIKGLFSGWIEDKTKTPEGARAVYTAKIEELSEQYAKANNILKRLVGRRKTIFDELNNYKNELSIIEKNCEALAKKQKWEDVEQLASRREDINEEILIRENTLKELDPQIEEAKFINNSLSKNLENMKKEKDRIIRELISKKQMNEIYDELDELKNVSTTSKMIQSIREGAKELSEQTEGAKVLYNSKSSTKYNKAMNEAKKSISNSYIDSLKSKYCTTSTNFTNRNK